MRASDVIQSLNLAPHPEGGWYRQTWQAAADGDARPTGTAIYYLLESHQKSHWHHVDAVEIWHYYAGAPLILSIADDDNGPSRNITLGPNLIANERPQFIVTKHQWQSARTTGDWTLVGCTVSPGFQFDGFTLADPDFAIPKP